MIKDSNTVVYFTHDYYSDVQDKNTQLLQAIDICKAYNIPRVIAVNPLEYINYYTDNGFTKDPYNDESNTHDEAM